MTSHDLERAKHEPAKVRPTAPRPLSPPSSEVVQPDSGEPCSTGHPHPDGSEPQVTIVGGEPPDERRRLLGNYPRRAQREVRPQAMEKVSGMRLRCRRLQH